MMKRCLYGCMGLLATALATAADPPAPPARDLTADDLYEAGQELFDQLAPAELKAEFEFPDKARWDDFVSRLQAALAGDSLGELAKFEPEARQLLDFLQRLPGSEDYQGWLEERIDYMEVAKQTVVLPPPKPPVGRPGPFIPDFELWQKRIRQRPRPAGAELYVPRLRPVFATGGVPGDLVWLAEVESTFNPTARSPSGARGLFQLMPATAKEMGLSTFLPDERTDPEKSARASARLLLGLYRRFHDWPLALAAYNAGGGRVQRTLERQKARTFAEIAAALPVETRMYVPKVLAVLQVRAGVSPAALAAAR